MMTPLPPWANGPFELLVHAEGHLRAGGDFDRRIALISFDDSIEVAITTYLSLHPIQRGNNTYPVGEVEKWLNNYHTKLDFLGIELTLRGLGWKVDRAHIVWSHSQRNEQYHGGAKGTPEKDLLALARAAALWVFGTLFGVPDCEERLGRAIAEREPPSAPQPDPTYDRAIDREYGMVDVGDQSFYASEVLFSVDYDGYRDVGARLCTDPQDVPHAASQTSSQ
jgi:hypothetical protein